MLKESEKFSTVVGAKEILQKALEERREMESGIDKEIKFGVFFDIVDLDELYKTDMSQGKAIDLDISVDYLNRRTDKIYMLSSNSIYSYKFGFTSDDPEEINEIRFSCKCGKTKSNKAGTLCEKCGTETDYRVAVRGWFTLEGYKVINPYFLSKLALNSKFRNDKINNKTDPVKSLLNELKIVSKAQEKKLSMSLLDLSNAIKNRDTSLMKQFIDECIPVSKKTESSDLAKREYFYQFVDRSMTMRIPVVSKDFRQAMFKSSDFTGDKIEEEPINKFYIGLSQNILKLKENDGSNTSKNNLLIYIQDIFNRIYELNVDEFISGKESLIRDDIGTRKMGYSGRLVVETAPLRVDEIILPYLAFGTNTIELYRDIYIENGLDTEGELRLKNSIPNVNDKIIMTKVLKRLKELNKNFVIALRPPNIYTTSIQGFRIIGLTNDKVTKISDIALSLMNGDKDGDTLTHFLPSRDNTHLQLYMSLNSRKATISNIMVDINRKFEEQEANYINIYRTLRDIDLDEITLESNPNLAKELDKIESPRLADFI